MRKILIVLTVATASMTAANAQTSREQRDTTSFRHGQTLVQQRSLSPNNPASPDSPFAKVRGATSQGFAPVDTEINRGRGSFR